VSNQNTYKAGENQSGIGLPHTGTLAFVHSAAHVAANCPEKPTGPTEPAFSENLEFAIDNLRHAGRVVCRAVENERGAK
jgi:hypothetical protein